MPVRSGSIETHPPWGAWRYRVAGTHTLVGAENWFGAGPVRLTLLGGPGDTELLGLSLDTLFLLCPLASRGSAGALRRVIHAQHPPHTFQDTCGTPEACRV